MNDAVQGASVPPVNPETEAAHEEVLKKTSVLLMVVLTFATFGYYIPFWFLIRRKALNALGGNLSIWPFVVVILLFATVDALDFTAVLGEPSLLALLFLLVGVIILYEQTFRVKSILEKNADRRDGERQSLPWEPKLSNAMTVLATIFYLQHKINSMGEFGAEKPPVSRRVFIWVAAFAGVFVVLIVVPIVTMRFEFDSATDRLRVAIHNNSIIEEQIGTIESLELNWQASFEMPENRFLVYDIVGDKGRGKVTAEVGRESLTLTMVSGESYELWPPP